MESIELLRSLIAKHHSLYQDLLKEHLVCKLHFLTHYPSLILKVGPIYAVSCLRFQAKHKWFKQIAYTCRSRKNICYTLAIRNQLQLAFRLQSKKGFHDEVPDYNAFKEFLNGDVLSNYEYIVSKVEINGTHYMPDMILRIREENGLMQFGRIQYILCNDENNVMFIILHLKTNYFIKHMLSLYKMERSAVW